jgi:hypothetical protein
MLVLLAGCVSVTAYGEELPQLFERFIAGQPVVLIEDEALGQGSYAVPLGAMQKIRGSWRPEESERLRGSKLRLTYRLEEGFGSSEVVTELDAVLDSDDSAQLLYSCEARACGNGAQWANRIFEERLLYGRAESQRLRAWRLEDEAGDYRAVVYASARSADRQYLRLEILRPDR